jgi:hypothetical protein
VLAVNALLLPKNISPTNPNEVRRERAKAKGSSDASFQQKPSVSSQLRFITPRGYRREQRGVA